MSENDDVDPEQYFSLCTGGLIKDINELAFAVEYLSDEELNFHVNEDKNDFSSWIRDIFKEPLLADEISEISRTGDKKDIQVALLKHLVKKR
ncbi:hypothetical protein GOV06_00240 [Candidatus Woesearchaeota archaeon]|nr:hypothetical protein [Candidatus Woesearchaeota archaeon]